MQHFQHKTLTSHILLPWSFFYNMAYKVRCAVVTPYKASVPVVCMGNVTVGGSGKTPACRAVYEQLSHVYKKPIIVSRGYGGSITAPTLVNTETHTAGEVGDEPLLLAKGVPVVVSKNKKRGVQCAEELGADLILLDDGLQNPTVYKDVTVVVVDGYRGFGNGRILPAGPLREYPHMPLKNAHMILVTGHRGDVYEGVKRQYGDKVVYAKYTPAALPFEGRQSVVPFAGIGNPDKFFETVRHCGYPIRAKISYPDHHTYTDGDIQDVRSVAATALAKPITTEKDYMRLSPEQRTHITPLCVVLKFDSDHWVSLITDALAHTKH